jgi:hypothetical protein
VDIVIIKLLVPQHTGKSLALYHGLVGVPVLTEVLVKLIRFGLAGANTSSKSSKAVFLFIR